MADTFDSIVANLDKLLKKVEQKVPSAIIDKAMPPAMSAISAIARQSFEAKLPDGVASGTRALQSKATAAKFPNHMKDEVETKIIKSDYGILAISGVGRGGIHVNIDFGDKAKTVGREHILWGKAHANPPLRVQRQELQDIPRRVRDEISQVAEGIIDAEVVKAIQNAT